MIEFVNWNWHSIFPIAPEIIMALSALALLVYGVFRGDSSSRAVNFVAMTTLLLSFILIVGGDSTPLKTLNNMVVTDRFSQYAKAIIALGLFFALMITHRSLRDGVLARFEYPILVLLSGIGMMLMVSSNNLLSLYVAIELQSLPLYVLAALRRDNPQSAEAGIKYFVLGALSSGFLLFGISLLYGFSGTIDFDLLAATLLQNGAPSGAVIGMVFLLTGIAFKMSAVPFHMWTPDVYQGAPTPVTALFAIVPKIAAILLLIRLLNGPFAAITFDWSQVVAFLAVASMAWGAFAGLVQTNIKRLLAYSSIGTMGYALLGVLAGSPEGVASVLFYMTVYMVMTAGTFAIILSTQRNGVEVEKISDLAGLSKESPARAYALAALMFSLSGIPPLAGFFSKFFVFQAAIESGLYVISVIGVLASVVAAYYYIRIIKVMFFDETLGRIDSDDVSRSRLFVASFAIAFILLFLLSPNALLNHATLAAQSLFG